jgi:CRP-like cAMP-binding protein
VVAVDHTKLDHNRLLKLLSPVSARAIARYLQPVHVEAGHRFANLGEPFTDVYFPQTCLISVLVPGPDGRAQGVAMLGREGFVGLHVLLNSDPTPQLFMCQIKGEALAMPVGAFRRVLRRRSELREILYQYAGVHLNQCLQLVACNSQHQTEQRLARWLLMARDAVGRNEFELTQELLAQMLAVRRSYLNTTMQRFQHTGLIKLGRRNVAIANAALLEAAACTDYSVIRRESERLIGPLDETRAARQ